MIRHVVMWKLKNPADAAHFKARLDSCADLTDGILAYDVGIRVLGLEANVDVVLVSAFADSSALAAYQNHPHHKVVSAELGGLRESRYVLDVEVSNSSESTL
jgi:quinol monooxygenase YgiN